MYNKSLRIIRDFSKSNEYRQHIHKLIPGGAHTYSKCDDQFPLLSPAAISHGKGAHLWDIDGNQFLDCSISPDGLDVEVFSFQSLERAYQEAVAPNEREHVTPYIRYSGKFKIHNTVNKIDYSDRRWTVDEVDDFEVFSHIFQYFHPDIYFDWNKIIEVENFQPDLFQKNKYIRRNEGAELSDDQKHQKRDATNSDVSKKG